MDKEKNLLGEGNKITYDERNMKRMVGHSIRLISYVWWTQVGAKPVWKKKIPAKAYKMPKYKIIKGTL